MTSERFSGMTVTTVAAASSIFTLGAALAPPATTQHRRCNDANP